MRELKFRAWDENSKQMYKATELRLFRDEMYGLNPIRNGEIYCPQTMSSKIIMQWTGLKDVDGVDIYEGDIIEDNVMQGTKDPNYWELVDLKLVIEWRDDVGAFMRCRGKYGYGYLVNNKRPKVIGNIYENWDLIKDDTLIDGERLYGQDTSKRI